MKNMINHQVISERYKKRDKGDYILFAILYVMITAVILLEIVKIKEISVETILLSIILIITTVALIFYIRSMGKYNKDIDNGGYYILEVTCLEKKEHIPSDGDIWEVRTELEKDLLVDEEMYNKTSKGDKLYLVCINNGTVFIDMFNYNEWEPDKEIGIQRASLDGF